MWWWCYPVDLYWLFVVSLLLWSNAFPAVQCSAASANLDDTKSEHSQGRHCSKLELGWQSQDLPLLLSLLHHLCWPSWCCSHRFHSCTRSFHSCVWLFLTSWWQKLVTLSTCTTSWQTSLLYLHMTLLCDLFACHQWIRLVVSVVALNAVGQAAATIWMLSLCSWLWGLGFLSVCFCSLWYLCTVLQKTLFILCSLDRLGLRYTFILCKQRCCIVLATSLKSYDIKTCLKGSLEAD